MKNCSYTNPIRDHINVLWRRKFSIQTISKREGIIQRIDQNLRHFLAGRVRKCRTYIRHLIGPNNRKQSDKISTINMRPHILNKCTHISTAGSIHRPRAPVSQVATSDGSANQPVELLTARVRASGVFGVATHSHQMSIYECARDPTGEANPSEEKLTERAF